MLLWTPFIFLIGAALGCSGSAEKEKSATESTYQTENSELGDIIPPGGGPKRPHHTGPIPRNSNGPGQPTQDAAGKDQATPRQPQAGFFCGEANEGGIRRIVNGKEAPPHRYPWQAFIKVWSDHGYSSCGGSLITDQDVLTAGHCVTDTDPKTKLPILVNYTRVHVYLGVHNRDRLPEVFKPVQIRTANELDKPILKSDLALIHFPDRIIFNTTVRPVCLPTDTKELYNGRKAIVSGWGGTDTKRKRLPGRLRETDMTIMNQAECKKLRQYSIHPNNLHLCAEKSNHGFCDGDSGGPLTVQENKRYVQVGVVSFGILECPDTPKGSQYPLIFARVTSGLAWIKSTVFGVFSPPKP